MKAIFLSTIAALILSSCEFSVESKSNSSYEVIKTESVTTTSPIDGSKHKSEFRSEKKKERSSGFKIEGKTPGFSGIEEVGEESWTKYEDYQSGFKNGATSVYAGKGLYETTVVLTLVKEGFRYEGNYYELKSGKMSLLSGKMENGRIALTESWQGKPIGYWNLEESQGGLQGTWQESARTELLPLGFKKLDASSSMGDSQFKKYNGFYAKEQDYEIFAGVDRDGKRHVNRGKGMNRIRVSHLGGKMLAFHHSVISSSGHQAEIDGIAKFTQFDSAEFRAEEGCIFRMKFVGGKVQTQGINCGDYLGEHVIFNHLLPRKL